MAKLTKTTQSKNTLKTPKTKTKEPLLSESKKSMKEKRAEFKALATKIKEHNKNKQDIASNPSNTPPSKSRSIFESFFILILTVSLLFWLGSAFYRAYKPKPQMLQGQIAAREYSISSKLPGRIANLHIKKGDMVQKGQLIYQIQSPELDAKYTQAKAGYEIAKAINEETHAGSRKESIASTKDIWRSAQAMSDLAQKTYERIEELYKNGVVSLQRRDEALAAYVSAKHNENAAYQQYQIALLGAREGAKKASSERQVVAQGQVDEVEAFLQDAYAYAPISGEVSNVLLHNGELSPSGFPVVMVVDMNDIWVRLPVSEQYLSRFNKGTIFTAYIPALKTYAKFKVSYISAMGEFATWKATNATRGYDMKTYEIEAHPISKIKNLRSGMSVLVKLD